jgi:4-hydroxy-3-polyprenylbenzoate decarboxylase
MLKKIVVGLSGASGAIYSKLLLDELLKLSDQYAEVGMIISPNALTNWELELPTLNPNDYEFAIYQRDDFFAPFASGSAKYDTMIICPCSMGMISRIAHGSSNDLMSRAADVILKERRKLILVPREAPYSTLHLENMTKISGLGGIICPASPSFYSTPKSLEEAALTVVHRVLDLAGFDLKTFRWGE